MAGRFSVEAVFKAVDRVTAPVSRMQNRVGKFTRSANRSFKKLNRTVDKFSSGLKRGAVVATGAALSIGVAMNNVIQTGADFGRAIGSAAAKFPEKIKRGTAAFKELSAAALQVGRSTEFTSIAAAKGLNFMAKAGWSAVFSVKALRPVVDFATASEMELAQAADIASDALGSFGLDVKDPIQKLKNLNRVMDVLVQTANSSNVSVPELFESIKQGGPITDAAGASIETFAGIMGFLANSGIKAQKAGVASKNIILALAGVGNQASKVFTRLGIKLEDSNGNLKDQLDVLDELRNKLSGMGSKQRVTIIESIFGKISLPSAMKLLSKFGGKARDFRKEAEKAGGSTKKIAAFIRNDVKGSLDGLTSAIEAVKVAAFLLTEGPLKKAIDQMVKWVRTHEAAIASGIGDFLMLIVDNFENIVKWGKRIGIALAIFIPFVIVLKTLALVIAVINGLMIMNPIGLTIMGIMALIAALAVVVFWWDELKEAFMNLSGPAKVIAALVAGPIGLLIAAGALIVKAWEPVKAFFISIGDIISRNFDKIIAVANVVKKFSGFNAVQSIASTVADFVGGDNQEDDKIGDGPRPQVVSPQDRVARSIEEKRTTSNSEITLRTDAGTSAEVTGGSLGPGLKLQPTGGF